LGCTSATDKSDSTPSRMDTLRVRNSIPRAVLMRSLLLSIRLATVIIKRGQIPHKDYFSHLESFLTGQVLLR